MSHSQVPATLHPFNAIRDFRSTSGLVRSKAPRTGATSAYEFVARGIALDRVGMKERTSFAYICCGSRRGVPELGPVRICVVANNLIFHSLPAHVILDDTRPASCRLTDNNITKTNILLRIGHSSRKYPPDRISIVLLLGN